MPEVDVCYDLAVALEKSVWLHCLTFANSGVRNWLDEIRREIHPKNDNAWRGVLEGLAKAKRQFPQLPISAVYSDIIQELIDEME